MSRVLAVIGYFAVVLLVALALARGWGLEAPDRGRFVAEIGPGESIDYALGPEVARVRMVSGVVLGDDIPPDARLARTYALDVVWTAPSGEVRRRERVWERTRLSRWPGVGREGRRPAGQLDDGAAVTDPRTTELPGSAILPGGGVLRIGVPEDGEPVVLRVFGAREPSDSASESAKAEELVRVARRVGVDDIDILDFTERAALLDETWRSLPFAATGQQGRLQRLRRDDPGLSPREESLAGTVLGPGQAIAITVVGPAQLRIDGDDALERLGIEAVGDLPRGAPPVRLVRREVRPSFTPGATRTVEVAVYTPVATSVVLRNPTVKPIGPFLVSLDAPSRERLHGWTPVAAPEVAPRAPNDGWALVGPERVEVPGVRIGPDEREPFDLAVPLGGPVLRFDVRPELDGADDVRPREVVLTELGSGDAVLREETYAVAAWPAPFERRAEDGGWVGEPLRIEVEPLTGARVMRITADAPVRVMAFVGGPPRGRDAYELSNPEDVRVRYARDPQRRWWRRWPADLDALVEGRQLVSVLANVRLAPREDPDDEGARHYAALRPLGGLAAAGAVWLVPGPGAFDLAWCRYDAGAPAARLQWDLEARQLRHGELRGVVHTPSASALGQPYRVELDGSIWRQGRIAQRVEPVVGIQEPPHRTARLVGPPGATLWLRARSDDPDRICHRGVEAWPLRAGGEARLPLAETWESRRLVLAGLASGPVRIEVAIEGLGESVPGVEADPAYVQEFTLRPGEDLGQRLTDPDVGLSVLTSKTLQIGAEVPSLVLRVRHLEGPQLWLRALAEVDELLPPEPPDSARVRGAP